MQLNVIVSGLVGALVTGGLSFIVRSVLDKRAQEEAERRVAYVYFVRVSEIVAADIVLRSFFSPVMGKEFNEKLRAEDGSYEALHAISAVVAQFMKEAQEKDFHKDTRVAGAGGFFRSILERTKESRLSPEQLSKFPKGAVYISHQFQKNHDHMVQVAEMWCELLDGSKAEFLVSPDAVHDQILTFKKFVESANDMRGVLVAYGACSLSHASDLLEKQIEDIHGNVSQRYKDAAPLEAAAEFYRKEREEGEDKGGE